jgi:hypothetical protein
MQELIAAGAVPPPPERWTGPAAGDRYMRQLGWANYRAAWNESPASVVSYLTRKSLRLWYATQSGRQQVFVGAVNVAWLALAIAGAVIAASRGRLRAIGLPLLTVAYFPVVLVAMFPLARYVVGFAPCLCVAGSLTCVAVMERVREATALSAVRSFWHRKAPQATGAR